MHLHQAILTLAAASILFSCAKSIPNTGFPKDIIPSTKQYELAINPGAKPIQVLYLGCGHLIIQYNGEGIVIDPFFSTHRLFDGTLQTSAEGFKKYQQILLDHQVGLAKTQSVWLAHTHYDHMMDLPQLIRSNLIPSSATLYGSNFGDTILSNFIKDRQYHSLTRAETYEPGNPSVPNFQPGATSIKILPIRSTHAPHFKLLGIPIHMMKGNIKRGYFKNFNDASQTTKRKQWKEGCTYSFLVDFMDSDKVAYRLFIQTSASHYPMGRPPESLIRERGVDAAFLCVASSNYVKKKYPLRILTDLQPKKIVWIHWEDFFGKPLAVDSTRMVRLTNFKSLGRRLNKSPFKPTPENQVMPRPGTMITIH